MTAHAQQSAKAAQAVRGDDQSKSTKKEIYTYKGMRRFAPELHFLIGEQRCRHIYPMTVPTLTILPVTSGTQRPGACTALDGARVRIDPSGWRLAASSKSTGTK
jgi:hypothetical protein